MLTLSYYLTLTVGAGLIVFGACRLVVGRGRRWPNLGLFLIGVLVPAVSFG